MPSRPSRRVVVEIKTQLTMEIFGDMTAKEAIKEIDFTPMTDSVILIDHEVLDVKEITQND
jgi:hypothetical protein